MGPEVVLDVAREATTTLLWLIAPTMIIALVVGLVVALFQALTSIQEMTLTFVPKILAVFVALLLLLPWMADRLGAFSRDLFQRIASGP